MIEKVLIKVVYKTKHCRKIYQGIRSDSIRLEYVNEFVKTVMKRIMDKAGDLSKGTTTNIARSPISLRFFTVCNM